MKNIIDYVRKYKNTTFKEKEFNILDSAILSIIPYTDIKEPISKKETLNNYLYKFFLYTNKKDYTNNTFKGKDNYVLIEELMDSIRYKDILVSDYIYKVNKEEQFAAITFYLDNNTKYIAFECTNSPLIGWEEDFTYTYLELTLSDKDAIKYLDKAINVFDNTIYVGGHSKGGRLALLSSMYLPKLKRNKVKKIYSFDGPGLSEKQFKSKEYELVKDRFIHILPNYSVIGLLLNHDDNYKVAKSSKIGAEAHAIFSWYIEEDDFKYTNLSSLSIRLENSIKKWLDNHTLEERRLIVKSVFNIFRDNNIYNLYELKNIRNIYNIIIHNNNYDKDTIKVIKNFLKFNISYIIKDK